MHEQTSLAIEGTIRVPYEWTTGEAAGRFLAALKHRREILGGKCGQCGRVYVPPQEYCGQCFTPVTIYLPVKGEGTVETYTVVYQSPWKEVVRPTPYIIALIRLDGASTMLAHFLYGIEPSQVRKGLRVKAVWEECRTGSILDIQHFRPI